MTSLPSPPPSVSSKTSQRSLQFWRATCRWQYRQTIKSPSQWQNSPKAWSACRWPTLSCRFRQLSAVVPESQTAAGECGRYKAAVHLGDAASSKPARQGQERDLFPKEDDLTSKPDKVKELALRELLKRQHRCWAVSMQKTELPRWPLVPPLAIRAQRKRL